MRVKYDKSSDLYIKYMAYVLRILVRPRRDPLEPQYPDGRLKTNYQENEN